MSNNDNTQLRSLPPSAPRPARRVALVLNGNAKAVTDTLIRDVRQVLRGETLFVSRSLEEWKFISRAIARDNFDVVLSGGGDGTFVRCVGDITALRPESPPAFGVLRLGTGNALADTLGAAPPTLRGLLDDLRVAQKPAAVRPLALLEVEGQMAPFTGVGLDSLILEDYNWVKRGLADTPFASLGQGSMGYFLACAGRSFWRFALEAWPEVTIRNEGSATRRMDLQGRAIGTRIPRGGIIYQGPAGIAAASTVPFYGLGLRLFPHALKRPDRFQLRVSHTPGTRIVPHLPALFRGEFEDEAIYDYFCDAVSIELTRPAALQIGGDEVGRRTKVEVRMTEVNAVWNDETCYVPREVRPAASTPIFDFEALRKAL